MNYKELFKTAMLLISSPAKAWEEIRLQEDRRKVCATFVYPMIGFCGLSILIGTMVTIGWNGPQMFQIAMTHCSEVAVSLFGGYYLAAYAINQLQIRMFKMPDDVLLAQQFAGYALVVSFLLHIVIGLLPDFRIIGWLLQFYVVYVVWEGASILVQIEEKNRLRFTFLSSLLLIICPAIIQIIFSELTAILN